MAHEGKKYLALLVDHRVYNPTLPDQDEYSSNQSQTHTLRLTVGRAMYLGVVPALGLVTRDSFLLPLLKAAVLSLWGALSDEMSGLNTAHTLMSHLYTTKVACCYLPPMPRSRLFGFSGKLIVQISPTNSRDMPLSSHLISSCQ
jgi:hypothetical protein